MVNDKQISKIEKWLRDNKIVDVELMVSDFAGISRGKLTPRAKFIEGLKSGGHRLPESLFALTINCGFIVNDYITDLEEDLNLVPDLETIRVVPWRKTPTACVICDAYKENGEAAPTSPRQVLQKVLSLYDAKGWQPIVAPEFEFFLHARQENAESEPIPPQGRSGKIALDKAVLSLDALDDFSDLFDDVYKYCDVMAIQMDTLTHEAGPAQFEINVYHGDPLKVADQSFYFKRLMKQAAIRHGMFASFMAQPYPGQFGSAMHIHQSVVGKTDGINIFADDNGEDTDLFLGHIAGLQKYIPALMPLLAPYANSYLRIGSGMSSPANLHWGRSGKIALDKAVLSLDALDDFSDLFDDVYKYCDVMAIQMDTLTHEAGPAQFEINVYHGDPLKVADQSFYFKRLMKQAAIRHGMFASFMAQPYPGQFGSAMHIHQSVVGKTDGINIFADDNGEDTDLFLGHIAGLQKYIPALMPLLAPYANSYLRIGSGMSSPANLHWGRENRSVGLRVPAGGRSSRRVENRVAGADVNPYLAIAASLLAGYLGMVENLVPSEALTDSAYDIESLRLPDHFLASLTKFQDSDVLREILDDEFMATFVDVKKKEYMANLSVLSSWEIRYLLMNV